MRSALLVAGLLVAGIVAGGATLGPASAVDSVAASSGASTRFCLPSKVILDQVERPILQVGRQEATVLTVTLKRTAKAAPRKVAGAMRSLASLYSGMAKASSDSDRSKLAFTAAVKFQTAQRTFATYYSTHCVQPPVSSPALPGVNAANQAACLSDFQTIQIAENNYSTLNGSFATIGQLVAAQMLRTPSTLHPSILIGTPPGGYTVVGNQVCNDVPVAG
jgi:hypothetical protein